jgi:hypothetical protein
MCLPETHPQCFKLTIPLTDEAALTVIRIGYERFILLI